MNAPFTLLRDRVRLLSRKYADAQEWLLNRSQTMVVIDAIPFQDEIDEVIAERPPPLMRTTQYLVAGLFVALILVSSIVRVDVVVVGTGRLATDSPPILLQPMERSIVRDLKVTAGQTVAKGQVLATLDPTFAQADVASLTAQERSLLIQVRRLTAEVNGTPFETGEIPGDDERLQSDLYRQRRAQYESRLAVFAEEINRLQTSIKTAETDRVSLSHQLDIAKDVETMRATLVESQTGSKLNYLEAESNRMRTERDYLDTINRGKELQNQLDAKQAEQRNFIEDWNRQRLEQLVAARLEATKVSENLAKATRLKDLVVVAAPADGIVLDVAKRSVGSIVREAEPLITMIPANARLIAEIQIGSRDVGYTKAGDEVVIKVDAFPYQRHGFLKGRLLSVGEESFDSAPASQDGAGTSRAAPAVHRGRVELLSTDLERLPPGAHLIPGMTLSAEIKVGTRSVISYFLYPITRGLSESIREP